MKYLKKLPFLIGASIIGTLILTVLYVLIKAVEYVPTYQAESTFYADYEVDPRVGDAYTYINAYSWNMWLHTDEMVEEIKSHLTIPIDDEELKGYLYADLPWDLRMPVTSVTTKDPELSLTIAHAVEEAMIAFGSKQKEIRSIRVVDSPSDTEKVQWLTDPGKHIALSALLSVVIIGIWFVCSELLSDGIWVPSDLAARSKLPVLGTPGSPGLSEHIRYIFLKGGNVGITTVTKEADPTGFRQVLYECTGIEEVKDWVPIPTVTEHPESCQELRNMEHILLVVLAAKRMGRKTDYVLNYLSLQDCKVTAAILWDKRSIMPIQHRLVSAIKDLFRERSEA
jgi:capsular polysaccharide biosynthesis protein